MKRQTNLVLLALLCAAAFAQQKDDFTDPRDGKKYKTIKIGEQVWMAENLNYEAEGSKCGGTTNPQKAKGPGLNIYTYYPLEDKNTKNCKKYGRLYDWSTAKEACPVGWHLPSDAEWDKLITTTGGEQAGKYLKAKNGWRDHEGRTGNGNDKFGFSALPGGEGDSDGHYYNGGYGLWWSTSEYNSYKAYCRYMAEHIWNAYNSYHDKSDLYSVRCLQD